MTKAALREKYLEWNRRITALGDRKSEIFHELQELSAECGGPKWCSLELLVEELVKAGRTDKTMSLVREYYEIDGKGKAMIDFAISTDNFKI